MAEVWVLTRSPYKSEYLSSREQRAESSAVAWDLLRTGGWPLWCVVCGGLPSRLFLFLFLLFAHPIRRPSRPLFLVPPPVFPLPFPSLFSHLHRHPFFVTASSFVSPRLLFSFASFSHSLINFLQNTHGTRHSFRDHSIPYYTTILNTHRIASSTVVPSPADRLTAFAYLASNNPNLYPCSRIIPD